MVGVTSTEPVNHTALRASRTSMDMTKAVLVLLVPVIIAVLVYVAFFGGADPIRIDASGTFQTARATGHFTVLEPVGLAKGWTPISASYGSDKLLRVGYVAPNGPGIQLVESARAADDLVPAELGDAAIVTGTMTINGVTWARTEAGDAHALVSTEAGRTVIVRGPASFDELGVFASSLR
jgi:hypothetical protein